jgi:sugar-specific transcriptional regulator TrmB
MLNVGKVLGLTIVVAFDYTDITMNEPIALLQELGLNLLEAEVYTHLLTQDEPVTAYRIGKVLGKPTANVYKAIEALARKGAVVLELGEPRLCRSVPAEEFLSQLETSFKQTTRQTARHLSNLRHPLPDERIYQIESVSLVFERLRLMLASAKQIAAVDVFPRPMEVIRPNIENAVARGVNVYVQGYEPDAIPGAHFVQAYQSDSILDHWKSQQLNCVVDGREMLLALIHNDLSEVYQAVWTNNLFIACLVHAGLMREHFFHEIAALKGREEFPESLHTLLEQHPGFHTTDIPGQKLLFSRIGVDEEGD